MVNQMVWLAEWPDPICPACGATPACGTWLGATQLLGYPVYGCDPYPCRCTPKYGGNCRYTRCDCWGRKPEDHLPKICCAYHPDNPIWQTAAQTAGSPSAALRPPQTHRDSPGGVSVFPRPEESTYQGISDDGISPPPAGYVRRWPAEALRCPCLTPWELAKGKTSGVHCCDCHFNFKSQLVYAMHRRGLEPCRHPDQVRDVDTGQPLLVLRNLVWCVTSVPTGRDWKRRSPWGVGHTS